MRRMKKATTKRPERILTDAELRAMREQCESSRDSAIFETLRVTGCRAHELLEVCFRDVDLENKRVYFRKTKARVMWKNIVEDGKKKRIHKDSIIIPRYSFLDGQSISALRIYMKEREKEIGKQFTDNMKIFDIDPSGDARTIRNIIKRLARAAKMPEWENIHPHTLRHTRATKLIAKGYPTPFIKKTMGWSPKSKTFETTYEHADWDTMQELFEETFKEDDWQKDIKIIEDEEGELPEDNEEE